MLSARQALWLVKMDLKELQKAHYKLLQRNKELLAELANKKNVHVKNPRSGICQDIYNNHVRKRKERT